MNHACDALLIVWLLYKSSETDFHTSIHILTVYTACLPNTINLKGFRTSTRFELDSATRFLISLAMVKKTFSTLRFVLALCMPHHVNFSKDFPHWHQSWSWEVRTKHQGTALSMKGGALRTLDQNPHMLTDDIKTKPWDYFWSKNRSAARR
jgi:hypothetical protein